MGVVAAADRGTDRLAELLPGVVLDGQHAVDVAVDTQRTNHMMR